jgi:hypothetical protein
VKASFKLISVTKITNKKPFKKTLIITMAEIMDAPQKHYASNAKANAGLTLGKLN